MSSARYFIPEHPTLTDVYTKAELRGMLQTGKLSRSEMVTDDETGIAYLLGDLLMMPFPDVVIVPARSTSSLQHDPQVAPGHEFRADTPLPANERIAEFTDEENEDDTDDGPAADPDSTTDFITGRGPSPPFTTDDGEDTEEPAEESDDAGEAPPDPFATARPPSHSHGDQHGHGAHAPMRPLAGIQPDVDIEVDDEESEDAEDYLYVGHPSWLAFPKALLLAAVCIASAVYFYQHNVGLEWITLPGSIAGLVFLFISLDRNTTTYIITSRRVEMEFGIIGRNTKEVRICDIRAIDVIQRGFDALIGVGTVKFDSSASAGPEVCFRHVRRPHALKQLVRELQG